MQCDDEVSRRVRLARQRAPPLAAGTLRATLGGAHRAQLVAQLRDEIDAPRILCIRRDVRT